MNYRETLNWMFAQLPMYQRVGAQAYKIDLSNTVRLAKYLENPENKFKSVHVAGTNGKGSTSHMLASILQEAGYRVGLYTSPHLKDFRERIRINGEKIEKEYITHFISKHQTYFEKNKLSFFEMTVGMAFQYFALSKVDIAIIEVGLGGRLDSTNIITPEVSVITNIGLDHTQFLGNTLPEIAAEKAGIIKPNIPVVIGEVISETKEVFKQKAKICGSNLFLSKNYSGEDYFSDLKGNYQKENRKTVLQTISVLQNQGWEINKKAIEKGMANVVSNTGLLGRWQVLRDNPKVICDTAHNRAGLTYVIQQLSEEKYDTMHMIIGVVGDKDLETILPLFPENAKYYFVKPNISRGLDEIELKNKAKKFNLKGKSYHTVKEAYKTAIKQAKPTDIIYIGGSTFVVAEII